MPWEIHNPLCTEPSTISVPRSTTQGKKQNKQTKKPTLIFPGRHLFPFQKILQIFTHAGLFSSFFFSFKHGRTIQTQVFQQVQPNKTLFSSLATQCPRTSKREPLPHFLTPWLLPSARSIPHPSPQLLEIPSACRAPGGASDSQRGPFSFPARPGRRGIPLEGEPPEKDREEWRRI